MKKFAICLALCLLCLLAVSCTGGNGGDETTVTGTTVTGTTVDGETTVADPVVTEEGFPTAPDETEEETLPETEEVTTEEPETEYVPAFDPAAFEPAAVPAVNVAREGFAMASSCRTDAGYTNLNLNDGDLSTKFSTGDVWDTAYAFWMFVDLTRAYGVESIKLYPGAGDEAGFPKAFEVLTSMDGETYTSAATVTDAVATAEGFEVALNGAEARFVKIVTKALQAPANGRGCYFALGEIEVFAPVDTATNAILNRNDAWLYVNPDIPMQLKVLYNRDGSAVSGSWQYMTTNPAVAMVDENGLVTPMGVGTAEIYATDGKNQSVCMVEVFDQTEDGYHLEAFYDGLAFYADRIGGGLDQLKAAGIEYVGGIEVYDPYGNNTSPYTLFLCRERGMAYQVPDEELRGKLPNIAHEELIRVVQKYEHRAGFYGIFLRDEPADEYAQYAELVRVVNTYNPHIEAYLNQYPNGSNNEVYDRKMTFYYQEVAAISGGNHGRLNYISFDHYPFMEGGGFDNSVFASLNAQRESGLLYNCGTAYYLQCYWNRTLTPTEQMYNASMGIAYGMKKFQWFTAFYIFSPQDLSPMPMYDGVVAANAYIKTVEPVLGYSDAIEVYHTDEIAWNDVLPSDFVFTHVSGGEAIYSLFEALDGSGKQHIVVTNKNYAADGVETFVIKVADGLRDLKLLDLNDGQMKPLTVAADGTITLTLNPGQCAVIELPDGFDASRPDPETDNLAINRPAYVSSTAADFWADRNQASNYMTDGDVSDMGWNAAADDVAPWIKVDLGEVYEISRVKITMTKSIWNRRCRNFTISVSEDGVNFTEVTRVTDFEWSNKTKCAEFTFDAVNARYVRFDVHPDAAGRSFGEIEIFA